MLPDQVHNQVYITMNQSSGSSGDYDDKGNFRWGLIEEYNIKKIQKETELLLN